MARQVDNSTGKARRLDRFMASLQFSTVRILIFVVILLVFVAGAVIALLNSLLDNPHAHEWDWTKPWYTILTVIVGPALIGIGAFLQWLFPTSPIQAQDGILLPVDKALPRNIVGRPPPISFGAIQLRTKTVIDIYQLLTQLDVNAVVLTGLRGVGKSILAALVSSYAEQQRHPQSGLFTAQALWLQIDATITMVDLASSIFNALDQPLPEGFTRSSPRDQAAYVFNALNTSNEKRLIVLDQFDFFLNEQTSHALVGQPGIGEWLDEINRQPCKCRLLLTSRLYPQGVHVGSPGYIHEYPIHGLELAEAMGLLKELLGEQMFKTMGLDLRRVVESTDGHAQALTELASLLRRRKLNQNTLSEDLINRRSWIGDTIHYCLGDTIQQLSRVQQNLLLAFSIYRKPVPLKAVLLVMDSTRLTMAQIRSALDVLLIQHLVQAFEGAYYRAQFIVANYVQNYLIEGNELMNEQILRTMHTRAAQYYLQQISDSSSLHKQQVHNANGHAVIETIWHYCQAEQWEEAYNLARQDVAVSSLISWKGNEALLEAYQLLSSGKKYLKRIQLEHLYNVLGLLYYQQGNQVDAQTYFNEALHFSE